MNINDVDSLAWDKSGGLLPAVIQHADTLQVLMLGYMNREALQQTLSTQRVTFFSRSKNRLWKKGESSGHTLKLVSAAADRDADTLLLAARPAGPTCHRGTTTCFGDEDAPGVGFLGFLNELVRTRERERPAGSYTTKLFEQGVDRAAQKVGEEAVETAIAAKNPDNAALTGEAADLIFHLIVLLRARGLSLDDAVAVLKQRHK